MKYPAIFFYTYKRSEADYTHTPTGQLNVNRFVQKKACWKKPNPALGLKKKDLILADWTAVNWSDERIKEVRELIDKLLADDFKIYIWQDGEAVPLKSSFDLTHSSVRKRMKITEAKTITNTTVEQYGLEKDSVHILNNNWIQVLLEQDLDRENVDNVILASDLKKFNLDEIKQITKILKKSLPYTCLIHDDFSKATNYRTSLIKYQYAFGTAFQSLNIDETINLVKLLEENRLVYIDQTTPFTLDNLADIEDLTLQFHNMETAINFDNINKLLSLANNTYSLSLGAYNPEDLHEWRGNFEAKPASLKKLNLKHMKLSAKCLGNFLNLETLQSLTVDQCNLLDGSTSEAATNIHLPLLENLHLCTNDPWSEADLIKLLSNSRNLQSLHLVVQVNGDYNNVINTIPKLLLKNIFINLDYRTLNNETNLKTLMKLISNKTETLRLTSFYFEDDLERLENISADSLEEIYLSYGNLKVQQLQFLLTLNKNIKSLGLNNLNFKNGSPILAEKIDLPLLQELSLNNLSISDNCLLELLSSKCLRSLVLDRCFESCKLSEVFATSQPGMLERIDLTLFQTLAWPSLMKQLSQGKMLSLKLVAGILSENIIDPVNTSKLEILDFNYVRLSLSELSKILLPGKKLKSLRLERCEVTGDLDDNLDLPDLRELNLNGCTITTKNLIRLLKAAKNLQVIDVKACVNADLNDPEVQELFAEIQKNNPKFFPPLNDGCFKHFRTRNPSSSAMKEYQSEAPLDPSHNPQTHLNTIDTDKNFKFEYRGTNRSKNQEMIIEKLSQYLTLKNKDLGVIPGIQQGICHVLAHLFNDKSIFDWDKMIEDISAWNGSRKLLELNHIAHFETILKKIKEKYHADQYYIGDQLTKFLKKIKPSDEKIILSNPWHSIALKVWGNNYYLYDPNYKGGYKAVEFFELENLIRQALGNLIMIEENHPCLNHLSLKINDTNAFLEDGGLLAIRNLVARQARDLIAQLMRNKDKLSKNSLQQALLLRNTKGKPAWVLGIIGCNSELKKYCQELLKLFAEMDSKNFSYILAKSIEHFAENEKKSCMTTLLELTKTFSKDPENIFVKAVKAYQEDENNYAVFSRQFETWTRKKSGADSLTSYCLHLSNGETRKQLIELSSAKEVRALALALENHCFNISRPVYYINSADDLVCSAPYIKRSGPYGELINGKDGLGGPLHDFLINNQDKANPPLLIVNYDNFAADDIVRLNSLLDDAPKADGTPCEHANIIGLINPKKPGSYQGEDFYSRFGVGNVSTCPLARSLLGIPDISENTEDKVYTIDLFHALDWQEKLLGSWQIQKDGLQFKQGLLAEVLASGLAINIRNGLWDNPDFCHFIDRLRSLPYIQANDEYIKAGGARFVKSKGYNWEYLKPFLIVENGINDKANVLNPGKFSDYFYRYNCDAENNLETLPGLIEEMRGQSLSVNLTRDLSEDAWAEILTECQKYKVNLHCHLASSVSIPEILLQPRHCEAAFQAEAISCKVTESKDIDVTISQLTKNDVWKIMDVSELSGTDLITNISGKLENKDGKPVYEFTQKECALSKALANNENVILKGRVSAELADALAPILLDPKLKANLQVVTSDAEYLQYAGVKKHEVTLLEKREALLSCEFGIDEINSLTTFESESFGKLRSRLRCPHLSNPWQGLKGISGGIKLRDFDQTNYAHIADAFENERIDAINAILKTSPFVFITGLTGVGKSTTIRDTYSKALGKKIHIGEDAIADWIHDNSEGIKILFIDEANISSREWSEFHGLLNDPPSIILNGEYHLLTKDHKVIFAGNPLNYGGERKIAPLFENNGIACKFHPMPLEFIYDRILKPILPDTLVALEILNVYRFLCECSQDEVLISPRELQMMALLTFSHMKKNPHDGQINIAQFYSRSIARALVPDSKLKEFDQKFPQIQLRNKLSHLSQKFVLTPSREPLYQRLNDLFALRELRRSNPEFNLEKLFGGLGGICIEGNPGIGKSELVTANLIAHGYRERIDFYRIPVSMQLEEKIRLLLQAFDEGAIVVMDEINSAPMMERLLNDLLMGKHPDGRTAFQPGFMIIGTQNPAHMGGRQNASTALKRRMLNEELLPYPEEELMQVLLGKNIEENVAAMMVKAYLDKLEAGRREKLSPLPTMRDLNNVADTWLKAREDLHHDEPLITEKSTKSNRIKKEIIKVENIQPIIEQPSVAHNTESELAANDVDNNFKEDSWSCEEVFFAVASLGMYAYLKNCIGLNENLTTPASIAKITFAVLFPPLAQLVGIFSIFCCPRKTPALVNEETNLRHRRVD